MPDPKDTRPEQLELLKKKGSRSLQRRKDVRPPLRPRGRMARAWTWAMAHKAIAGSILAAVVAVVTVTATVVEKVVPLLPNPITSIEPLTESSNPFSLKFKITNEGWIPARSLRARCFVLSLDTWPNVKDNIVQGEYSSTSSLKHRKSQTVTCPFRSEPPPKKADLAIVVHYDSLVGRPRDCTRHAYSDGAWREESCADILDRFSAVLDRVRPEVR